QILGRVLENCLVRAPSITGCLEGEAASVLGRALKQENINLMPGLALQRTSPDPPQTAEQRAITDPSEKLWDNLQKLMATRSININFSQIAEEGRGKKKKKLLEYMMVAALSMAAFMVPLKLKVIALMAISALFIGKIALVLSGLAGLKKLVGHQHEETTHLHYDNHRNDQNSHYLAYSAHAP
ncbi:hypothetical protein AAG570_001031, partial [Ranatra chinensis]